MRRTLVTALALSLLAAACSSDDPPQADETPAPTATATAPTSPIACEATTTIVQRDNGFEPACLTFDTQHAGLTIRNDGAVLHNFSVDGFVHDVDTRPGEETNTENLGLDAGTYRFSCKYHEDIGMEGELRIEEG